MKGTRIEYLHFVVTMLICSIAIKGNSVAQKLNGDERLEEYIPIIQNLKVGVVCNQTSVVGGVHLVDTLLQRRISIKKIFSPEHGFKGNEEAGKIINGRYFYKDTIPVISLYGKNKAPTIEQMQNIDIILFDLQDVGCRFYTYISTLEYVMKACINMNKPIIVLDRPNPNNFVAGCVLMSKQKSFVGMQPVPICYGLTIGEYAQMINGEHWVDSVRSCNLHIITMKDYIRDSVYEFDIYPSPNLHSMQAIINYPSLCLFEGTSISVGRGTEYPFEVIGYDSYKDTSFAFMPKYIKGVSENPLYKDKKCFGVKVALPQKTFTLKYLIEMYRSYPDKKHFFNNFFPLLAGNTSLQKQIIQGKSEKEILKSYEKEIFSYLKIREKYLLY